MIKRKREFRSTRNNEGIEESGNENVDLTLATEGMNNEEIDVTIFPS